MFKVGDRVRILYAGPRPSLVGKKGTIVHINSLEAKYDYRVRVDGTKVKIRGFTVEGEFYFYIDELEKI